MTASNRDGAGSRGGRRDRQPPNTDMQPEDAGTRRSGQAQATVRGAAANAAMKQQSKTGQEPGGGRR